MKPRLCVDCRHRVPMVNSKCERRKVVEVDLVDGEARNVVISESCRWERGANWLQALMFNRCGKKGRFFESKPSVPTPIEKKIEEVARGLKGKSYEELRDFISETTERIRRM